MVRVLGIDRAAGGWVGVVLEDGAVGAIPFAADLPGILAAVPQPAAIGIDIPIGLPEHGARRADEAARAWVGVRRSSVFLTPPLAVLEAPDHAAAVVRSRADGGRGVSIQAYGLRATIFEAERAAGCHRLYEVHPEASFRALAGEPLVWSKKTWNGQAQRRALLAGAGIVLPERIDGPAGRVPVDDVLDAAVVAWTADRIAAGRAATLPADPAPDEPVIHY